MTVVRHLERAPITEALIDFRVKLAPGVDVVELDKLDGIPRDKYPIVERLRRVALMMEGVPEKRPHAERVWARGYLFKSEDGKNIVQFREDGFTFNRLRPYTDWSAFSKEAKSLWEVYLKAPVEVVTRVAVRYINDLDLQLPINLGEYLAAPPVIPPGLPQEVSSFFTRYVVHDIGSGASANVTQALRDTRLVNHASILLDIDVYRTDEAGVDIGRLWEQLETLRGLKNRIFFESITERTVKLFE